MERSHSTNCPRASLLMLAIRFAYLSKRLNSSRRESIKYTCCVALLAFRSERCFLVIACSFVSHLLAISRLPRAGCNKVQTYFRIRSGSGVCGDSSSPASRRSFGEPDLVSGVQKSEDGCWAPIWAPTGSTEGEIVHG
jgi:hypothetical protein